MNHPSGRSRQGVLGEQRKSRVVGAGEGGEDGEELKLEREPRARLCLSHGKNHRLFSKVDGVALLGFKRGNDLILFVF